MNKNFTSHTLVKPNSIIKGVRVTGLKHTTLEDVMFEKKFDVYTNDEVDARYLLTTSFMERLTNMKTVFNSGEVSCAFYQDNFVVAMNTKRDMFKIGSLFKLTDNEEAYYKMYEEIESIIKLIDHFKLNQRIGL